MKHDHWKQFSWNLSQLLTAPQPLSGGLIIRQTEKVDEAVVQALTTRAFSFDEQWTGSYRKIASALEERIHEAFRVQPHAAVVVVHGPRIIAASCMSTDSDADNHLFSGPCVLPEYRSRGLGTALLLHSLHALRHAGLHVARAVCKNGTTVSKFIYPKFGSVVETYDSDPFTVI